MPKPDSNNPLPPSESLSNSFLRSLFSMHKSMKEGKDMELVELEILEDTTDITGDSSNV
jgi:hypothetical protein